MVDDAAGDHETWVEGSSGNPTKRVPCSVVKPIPEFVEAIRNQVFRSSKVEPGVDWIRSALEGEVANSGANGHSWIMLSKPVG